MSTPARIDELRKKFDENPRRYFAPLANEYRKAGDLAQAIALCREYLPKQPGHMSGHIVFGQALYEAGGLDEARDVFESALALDPENLIALRHLGDIAKAGGDAAGARRWYERVLDADPRNDDIAAQLATLATSHTPRSSAAVQGAVGSAAASGEAAGAMAHARADSDRPDSRSMPEPDPSMRAVDFDVVNAEVARSTPLYSEAIAARADLAQQPSPQLSQPVAPRDFEPLDLDAMDAAEQIDAADEAARRGMVASGSVLEQTDRDLEHAAPGSGLDVATDEGEEPAHDAPAGFAGNDIGEPAGGPAPESTFADAQRDFEQTERDRPPEAAMAASAERASDSVYDSDFVGTEFEDDEFEGGILAPEWPQASELIARIGTPRSSTPVSVRVTPEAVAAFGREPHERMPGDSGAPDDSFEERDTPPAASQDAATAEHAGDAEHADDPMHGVASEHASQPGPTADLAAENAEAETLARTDEASVEASDEPPRAEHMSAGETEEGDAREATADGNEVSAIGNAEHAEEDVNASADAEAEAPESATGGESGSVTDAESETFAAPESRTAAPEAAADYDAEEASFADIQVYDDESVPEAQARPEPSAAFVTETMGELLVSQGFIERAVDVYEELVRRRPYDPVLTSRLAELRERLEHRVREAAASRAPTPSSTGAFATTPPRTFTPQYVTPRAFTPRGFTPQSLTPPASLAVASAGEASPDAHEMPQAEPVVTARELFARLAGRRVPRRTPPAGVPGVHDSGLHGNAHDTATDLSTLFGGAHEQNEDSAARALADAFAPIGAAEMADGSSMDFGPGGGSERTLSTPAARASHTPPQGSVNVPGGIAPAPPAGNSTFSFDRFFPDPARRATPAAPTTNASPSPASDDLAEFSAWLKGLGNK